MKNCVPQISGITIAESISITFFALTIFNVLLLLCFYEIVAYGMATCIKCNRIFAIIYGVILVVLAICAIVLESEDMDNIAGTVWAGLSSNQKGYFDNTVDKLKDERNDNNLFVGIFAIVIGLCFIIIGGLMFKLHQLQAPSIVKAVNARLFEPMRYSEQMTFISYTRTVNELDDTHHASLKPYYPKAKVSKAKRKIVDEQVYNNDSDLESDGADQFARQADMFQRNELQQNYGRMY